MIKPGSKSKKIGVDVDGVIVDTAEVYLRYIEKVCGRKFSQNEVTSYFFHDCVDVSEEEVSRALEMMIDDNVWDEIPFYDGAREVLQSLGRKHNLYIVTSRPPRAEEPTRKWVEKSRIPARDIIFTDMETKLTHLRERNIVLDYFIEDRWEFAREISSSGTKVFLIDRPWNRNRPAAEGIVRVSGLKEAAGLII